MSDVFLYLNVFFVFYNVHKIKELTFIVFVKNN